MLFRSCVEHDTAAVAGLLDAAREWIAAAGRAEALGPLSFTLNHEVGAQAGELGGNLVRFEAPPDGKVSVSLGGLPVVGQS